MSLEAKEKLAFELIEQGNKDQAVKVLYELIVSHAESGHFDKADSLRQTLMDTDAMALTEIINSGEIIEDLKSKGINPDFRKTWHPLFETLSPEEANGFYYALKTVQVGPGKTIIQQGKINDKLFFIHSGQAKTICHSGPDEVMLKVVTSGEVSGMSSFFAISLATTTVITVNTVQLSYLTRKKFLELMDKFPGFDTKFDDLCRTFVKTKSSDIIREQNADRRGFKRFKAAGKVATFIIGADGQPSTKPLYGLLDDISRGGASFLIKSSKKEAARSLLGRSAIIKLISSNPADKSTETKKGIVTGLQDQLFNDYMLSFKFYKPLAQDVVAQFIKKETEE
ncbi:MAG: cyclic nucleotide-binding domain-containing protein [Desulfobacteraceae bacterium]|nr:MAG: cyclic nucleotide-binding domain-containing protein [Desulfobacteraceae bacterium]